MRLTLRESGEDDPSSVITLESGVQLNFFRPKRAQVLISTVGETFRAGDWTLIKTKRQRYRRLVRLVRRECYSGQDEIELDRRFD